MKIHSLSTRSDVFAFRWSRGCSAVLLAASFLFLFETNPAFAHHDDPSSRVARLSLVGGAVSLRPAIADDWGVAGPNTPITTGDHLWCDNDSRAELEVGDVTVHLAARTGFSILDLDDDVMQLRLTDGSILLRVRDLDADDVIEVDTPNAAVTILRAGTYRIDVSDNGEITSVTVRRGQAEVAAGGSTFPVRSSELATISGIDEPTYDVDDSGGLDAWERWAMSRNRRFDHSKSREYVSPDVIGYSDLDDYGRWSTEGNYGSVWYPNVSVDWCPYRYGRWAWIDPWGWTWIDDASWGFAPFHYGRWAHVDSRWCWVPGARHERALYAPALVVFLGGEGWGTGMPFHGGNGVGWFPLGPREPYVPVYHGSDAYIRRLNAPHIDIGVHVNLRISPPPIPFVNRGIPGGITAVSHDIFVSAGKIGSAAIPVPPQIARGGKIFGSAPPLPPGIESVMPPMPGSHVTVPRPPVSVIGRPVVARITPPLPPLPFLSRDKDHKDHPGTPVEPRRLIGLRNELPAPVPDSSRNDAGRFQAPGSPIHPLVRPIVPPRPGGGENRPQLRPKRDELPPTSPAQARPPHPADVPDTDQPRPRRVEPDNRSGNGVDRPRGNSDRPSASQRPAPNVERPRVIPVPDRRPVDRPESAQPERRREEAPSPRNTERRVTPAPQSSHESSRPVVHPSSTRPGNPPPPKAKVEPAKEKAKSNDKDKDK